MLIALQNYRDLNQCILHLWSEFGDPSLNGWLVMVRTSSKWGNLDFGLIFDLEGKGWSLHKTIGTLTKLFCTFGPNLVILAWTGPELLPGQAIDTQPDTHRHTDAGNDNTRRLKLASGKKWLKTWIMIYFGAQNDSEIGPLKVRGGVERNGRTACSFTGDYRTANDTWKSSVHKHCHASPWRCIVASWRQLLWRHEGDVPEVVSVAVVITKRLVELWQLRYQIFGTAVSKRPGHFLVSWLGAVGSM